MNVYQCFDGSQRLHYANQLLSLPIVGQHVQTSCSKGIPGRRQLSENRKTNKNCSYNTSAPNFNNTLTETHVNILNITLYTVGHKIERGRKADIFHNNMFM